MSNLTKLKFRIVSFSSEDNDFPVTELLKHGPQSKGWQSARFQDFPQMIVFQFICPVQIQQLQFLSHQSKISSKIEIFTYMPENPSVLPPMEQFKWKRLGYLSLDNNEKSGFQARELKSVFIDIKALFLKLSMNKCHVNKYNMFNQIGLIAINALGEELGDLSAPSRKGIPPRLENELEFDPVTSERLKQLAFAKERAVENEDFDEAKRLREAIERLRSVGQQLFHLEERKKIAIVNEDYDSAKVIKSEIDRLRTAINPPSENNYFNRPFSGNQPSVDYRRPGSKPQFVSSIPQDYSQNDYEPNPRSSKNDMYSKNDAYSKNDIYSKNDAYSKNDIYSKNDAYSKNDIYSKNEIYSKPDPYARNNQPVISKPPVSYDEQVIPTVLHGKDPGQIYDEDDAQPRNASNSPEPLGVQQSKQAEPFVHIIGEDLCRKIFSKNWQFREEGLDTIQSEIIKDGSSELFGQFESPDIYTGVLGAIRYTVGDKVAKVSLKSMGLLGVLLNQIPPSRSFIRGEASEYLQTTLVFLLDKIGDNNPRVSEIAEQSFLILAKSDIIGIGPAVQLILKPNKEKSASQKHNLGRLNLLMSLVEEYQIDNSLIPFQPVVDYAITGFSNSNSEIRNAAYNLLMVIYGCTGEKLENLIKDSKTLRPAQVDMLLKGFSETDPGTVQESKPYKPTKKETTGMCEYCGKNDPIFEIQDNLDIHYWKDCPMLVACLQCSQIVEILHLNSHMLKECELSELVGQCPRCKEAIHMDEFEQHVEEQACLAAKPPSKANRCPLCHDDVDPGPSGWMKHILTEGCPNNDRSNY